MLDIFPKPQALTPDFFAGGGEMGERIRGHDWAGTSLGAAGTWPQGLRTAVRIMLASREPMGVWWGRDLANLYNDACRALIGGNHPAALGQPAPSAWREVWEDMAARVESAIRGDELGDARVVRLLVQRRGRVEEAHYTLSFTSLPGESGTEGGVLFSLTDITQGVVGDRQMGLLKEIAARGIGVATLEGACTLAAEALASSPADIPFAAIYLVDEATRVAKLAAIAGIARGHAALPDEVAIDGPSPWPFREALADARRGFQRVMLGDARYGALPCGPWGLPPREAAVVSLGHASGEGRTAVLIAALNPFHVLNDAHRRFVELVASQVATGICSARARTEEIRRQEAETLREVAFDISSDLDLQQVVQKVTDAGTRLTGAVFGAFFYNVTDAKGRSYQLFTLSGAPRQAFEKFGMPRSTPIFEPTFLGQGTVRLHDVTQDPRYGKMAPHHGMPQGHLPVKSYLAVPVVASNGDVLGGLFFGHPQAGVFDERSERNATSIAAQAAVAIANAHHLGRARESERHSRELVDCLPAAVYTTDAEGRIDHYNPAAIALWGREPRLGIDKWCGSSALLTPAGDAMALEDCPMARVLQGGAAGNSEIVIERPDGSQRHAIAHPRAIHDDSGRLVGAVNMLVDITERKAAEAELAFTKDQLALQVESLTKLHELAMQLGGMTQLRPALKLILDTAVDTQDADFGLLWLQDPDSGRLVVEVCHGFEGVKLDHFRSLVPGAGGGSAGNAFAQRRRWIVEDTQTDPVFAPFREAARIVGFRAVHSTPIVTRSGALLGVISVHYAESRTPLQREMQVADVCARHAADAIEAFRNEEALRESEAMYRAIGESMDFGVWTADGEGRNTFASESFLRLTGITLEECAGNGWAELVHPDDLPGMLEKWADCLRDGAPLEHEYRVKGADGEWHSILGRAVALRNERGVVTGWAGINLDIARQKRVENELRELDTRKNEFLATLAHELRNPLAPLRNGLEVMRLASGSPETVEKARGMMERQLGQMVRLVDDLLDVSRVSRGKIELRRASIELAAVLRNAIETSQPLFSERGHKLEVAIPGERIVIDADMTRMSQVFANLLNNAAKYTEAGGRIAVSVRVFEGEVAVSVKDNGIGIPPDMLTSVFDIFTQVDRGLERSQGGLGIGLSIAKRLVEMHGGTVEVKSGGNGMGSEFIVRLPARVEAPPAAAPEPARPSGNTPRHRILIADDNSDSATTLSLMLRMMGNDVRVARDGQEAVEAAAEFVPDVILLDIGMPRMNGYEACETIRAQASGRGVFIVALTGWGQDDDKNRARAAGFDRHLVKPVEPATLEAILEALPPSGAARA